ncbi:transporter substrate-binding domain-containing protein [Sphingomonas aliaeris]|uniref:Transporter substrate-binding domain-containing protein n=1 Tax=Sphingomonas aliaeris TaxID=2759526 RepID=A0A974NV72_9SPHN|nr:transporter substrate-binding domain-containing protein [Sphingomonas aliaeris]QQV77538.1 transporter substrate-binding domain-containing protein [Sphingomonas aliaeris]
MSFTRRNVLAGIGAAIALPAIPLRAASLDKVKAAGVLHVGVYRDFEPWAWMDGDTPRGIDVELGQALAAKIGVKAQIRDYLAGEDVDEDMRIIVWKGPATGGQLSDVMMHVPYDRAFALRNEEVVIVAPYYREGFALACGKEVDCELPPPQFKGRKLVAELDSIPDFYLSGSFGGVLRGDVQHVPSGMAALGQVRDGKSDVAMATRAQVEHAMVGVDPDAMRARKGPLPALTSPGWDIALAVKDNSRDLGDTLESVMGDLKKDGTVAAILKKYGVAPRDPIAS